MPGIALSCLVAAPLLLPVVAPPTVPGYASFALSEPAAACSEGASPAAEDGRPTPAAPVEGAKAPARDTGVHWGKLANDSARFLILMHAFRWAKEPGTRAGGVGLGAGYRAAVGNLHGWSDGDPFYVNYVGHPMQGAVSGRLFLLNDPRFNRTEFGKSPEYWKGKLRAALFAWAFSEQFEIGPFSEASIGHIQRDFPQQGFVDHVVTPSVGLAWMVAEDAMDRFVIRPFEDRTKNKWLRIALRAGLNPTRSFANLLDGRAPWDRGTRSGILEYRPEPHDKSPRAAVIAPRAAESKPAPFEVSFLSSDRQFGKPCIGGGAEGAYRALPTLQIVLAVNGCKMTGLKTNLSGDALVYQVGPRWTPSPAAKWSPYAHFLVGGIKLTQEQLDPALKVSVEDANRNLDPSLAYTLHDQYTTHDESSGVAITAGTGLLYRLNAALALRVVGLDYFHASVAPLSGTAYNNGFQVSTGMILRLGNW